MSTRAIIARKTPDGWEGRYHHFDGYPSGLGAALHEIGNEVFGGDIGAMMTTLIDDHPAGWSNIQNVDWTREPGFGDPKGPECYCHGQRHEGPDLRTSAGAPDCFEEYLYVVDVDARTIAVYATPYPHERDALHVATVPFGCSADWRQIEHWGDHVDGSPVDPD